MKLLKKFGVSILTATMLTVSAFGFSSNAYAATSCKKIIKPKKFDEMIDLSRKLSSSIPHVRVDFYIINGKVYFGELTFFDSAGLEKFTPEKYDEILGSYIDLNKIQK